MRIIAGTMRSRLLTAPDTERTRPTTDRARESLFNALSHQIDFAGIRVLDLFAGSGALGLEAMSRGAQHVTFIESDRKALEALRKNIAVLGVTEHATVVVGDVYQRLKSLPEFELVLSDAPYGDERARLEVAELALAAVRPKGLLAIEHRSSESVVYPDAYEKLRELKAGEAGFTILRRTP
jgi:16S rRNA (guanine966-N2)-methyltransferase